MICELRTPIKNNGKLALCIGSGPTEGASAQAVREGKSALEQGYQVKVFLFGNGIYHALDCDTVKSSFNGFNQLMQGGAEVTVCANMARSQGVLPRSAKAGIHFGSLLEFSDLVVNCEKVLVFGGQGRGQA
jgi:sulfur relay (sulfurtransferase) complex TusBCD TusD component (DsrE family)